MEGHGRPREGAQDGAHLLELGLALLLDEDLLIAAPPEPQRAVLGRRDKKGARARGCDGPHVRVVRLEEEGRGQA